MTQEQKQIYQTMQLVRFEMNQPETDRETLERELETLRRGLGGLQFAEMPDEAAASHKNDLLTFQQQDSFQHFVKCTGCSQTFHYSVVGDGLCYSCSKEA